MKMVARRGDPWRSDRVVFTCWPDWLDIYDYDCISNRLELCHHKLSQPSLVHQDPNTFSKASLEPPTEIGEIREELDGYFVSGMQFGDLNSFSSKLRTKEQRWVFHSPFQWSSESFVLLKMLQENHERFVGDHEQLLLQPVPKVLQTTSPESAILWTWSFNIRHTWDLDRRMITALYLGDHEGSW